MKYLIPTIFFEILSAIIGFTLLFLSAQGPVIYIYMAKVFLFPSSVLLKRGILDSQSSIILFILIQFATIFTIVYCYHKFTAKPKPTM
jgi:hypothetical protein